MGKKSSPPREPNLQPIADAQLAASRESMEIAREQMGLSREQWAWFQKNAGEELAVARQQADRAFGLQERMFSSDEEMNKLASAVGSTQMDAMRQQMEYGKRDRERYENTFIPMQDRMIAEADAYATPERREAEAARIGADIQRQAEAQRGNADARLRSMGVDPSQVRSTSMANQMGVATAANQAMGMNAAREMIDDKGRAMRADAINLGTGLPMQSLAGFGAAGQAGQGALQAGQAGQNSTIAAGQAGMGAGGFGMGARNTALQQYGAMTGTPMQWAGQANQSMGMGGNFMNAGANTMNQGYANRYQRWQGVQEQGQRWFDNMGSIVNSVSGFMAEGGEVKRPALQRRHMAGGGFMSGQDAEAKKDAKGMKRLAESAQQQGNIKNLRAASQANTDRSNAEFAQSSGLLDMGTPMAQQYQQRQIQYARPAVPQQYVDMSGFQRQPTPQGTVSVGEVQQIHPGDPGYTNYAEGGSVFDPMNSSIQGQNVGGYNPTGGIVPANYGSTVQGYGGAPGGGALAGGPSLTQPYNRTGGIVPPNYDSSVQGRGGMMNRDPASVLGRTGYRGGAARQDGAIARGSFRANMAQQPRSAPRRGPYGGDMPGQYGPSLTGQRPGAPYQSQGGYDAYGGGHTLPQGPVLGGPGLPQQMPNLSGPSVQQFNPQYGISQQLSPMQYQQPQNLSQYGPSVYMAEGGQPRGALPVKQARDRIPAMLAEGEYVLPADVVRSLGLEKIDKLVAKYHRPGA